MHSLLFQNTTKPSLNQKAFGATRLTASPIFIWDIPLLQLSSSLPLSLLSIFIPPPANLSFLPYIRVELSPSLLFLFSLFSFLPNQIKDFNPLIVHLLMSNTCIKFLRWISTHISPSEFRKNQIQSCPLRTEFCVKSSLFSTTCLWPLANRMESNHVGCHIVTRLQEGSWTIGPCTVELPDHYCSATQNKAGSLSFWFPIMWNKKFNKELWRHWHKHLKATLLSTHEYC